VTASSPSILRHGKSHLALHELRSAPGPSLLLLHGLGGRSPADVPAEAEGWPGGIWALDFTGHGSSTLPIGGGYTAEVLLADADAAIRHLEGATVLGRGLGAYVALLLAGARPLLVRGAVLADGVGLAGGGIRPGSPALLQVPEAGTTTPDPFALAELSRDVRPPDYATAFAQIAVQFSGLTTPIAVSAVVRPEWLEAVCAQPGVVEEAVPAALARFASR
jgi:pimeloyl-ACP methyl ester carboxylesterase